jgi:hypothetical protein
LNLEAESIELLCNNTKLDPETNINYYLDDEGAVIYIKPKKKLWLIFSKLG